MIGQFYGTIVYGFRQLVDYQNRYHSARSYSHAYIGLTIEPLGYLKRSSGTKSRLSTSQLPNSTLFCLLTCPTAFPTPYLYMPRCNLIPGPTPTVWFLPWDSSVLASPCTRARSFNQLLLPFDFLALFLSLPTESHQSTITANSSLPPSYSSWL